MDLRKNIYQKKSIASLVKRIKETYLEKGSKKKNIALGFGNWSENTQMKGCSPSMSKGFRKELAKYFKLCKVAEYNTSAKCNGCHKGNLKHKIVTQKKDGKMIKKSLHRVLVCAECVSQTDRKSTVTNHILNRILNRDKNAAKKILVVI